MEIYLKQGAFKRILVGSKTVELRKYINIFKDIQVSDMVYFINNNDKILVEVTDIMVSDLFTLLSKINIKKTGFFKNEDYIDCLKKCYSDITGDMVAIEFKVI
tara:strand:+ start:235 stop:543 length:309 start_codon:yes stop_codon:yes gene_type:complete